MTKHALTCAFFFIFTHFVLAQLTLQEVGGTKKRVIPAETSVDLIYSTKTFGLPEKAFQLYSGRLKKVDNTGVGIAPTFENHYFVNENGVTIQQYRDIQLIDTPVIVQMPLTKMRSIAQHYPTIRKLNDAGAYLFFAAIVSSILVAPHLKEPQGKMVRNAGFVAMGLGLSMGFIPNKRKYYLEQPKNGHKKLWKLI